MRKSERPLPLVTLEPLWVEMQAAVESLATPFSVQVLVPERLDPTAEELPPDLPQKAESLVATLPDGPVLLVFQDGDSEPGVDLLVRTLARHGREFHLAAEGPFAFEGRRRVLEALRVLRQAVFPARSVTLLDARRIQGRFSKETTIQTALTWRSRMLALLLSDLHAILSTPRNSRIRRRLAGVWEWEGTWPDEAPSWSHLTRIVRRRDGEHPVFAVVQGGGDPRSTDRLKRRLERLGMPVAWRAGTSLRAGAFFPEALDDWR